MLLCRSISIFTFLFSMAPFGLFHKSISQDNLDANNTEVVRTASNPEITVMFSENNQVNNNSTCDNDPLLKYDEYGAIIEKFIDEMEAFWLEIKECILKQNSKKIPPGKWWHESTESKYNAMKAKFYNDIPAKLPQTIIDVITEYEMRYNDLMWREIEQELSIINDVNANEYITDSSSAEDARVEINEANNKTHKSLTDLINVNTCAKKNFNDLLFEAKFNKTGSLLSNDYDEEYLDNIIE